MWYKNVFVKNILVPSAHYLNLVITFSCKILEIRNSMRTIQCASTFFGHPKRQSILQLSIEEVFPQTNRLKLKNLCATRWVEIFIQ